MKKTFALLWMACLIVGCANSPAIYPTASPAPQIAPINPPTAIPATATPVVARPIVINSRDDLQSITREIVAAEPIAAQARADELWQYLVKEERVPLIFGQTVIFFYKGQADQVQWRGMFNRNLQFIFIEKDFHEQPFEE
ncbi:MAG TPA: hypothetical protein VFK30_11740 [Anaerolineae bacterium]|nr:hypothetical protein [Anaerolineae bacterium]